MFEQGQRGMVKVKGFLTKIHPIQDQSVIHVRVLYVRKERKREAEIRRIWWINNDLS